jgi:hypothetical protein
VHDSASRGRTRKQEESDSIRDKEGLIKAIDVIQSKLQMNDKLSIII